MALLVAASAAGTGSAAEISRASFGKVDGQAIEAITLSNAAGTKARIISYGASIQSLMLADRKGHFDDVIVGPGAIEGYLVQPQFFGATVGRVANRIARGRFTLDGKSYQTPVNNGVNSLHGGSKGFDKVVWEVVSVKRGPSASVTLRYVSPDGDEGYPGTLTAVATYSLDESNVLTIDYTATTDKPTVVNLSNHAYWNLAGEGAARGAMGHLLTIPADHYTPTDVGAIPTGEIRAVAGTVFDFRKPTAIGARVRDADQQIIFGKGYDHNWLIDRTIAARPRLLARVEEPISGRVMEMLSNQPGLQFYSGNFLDATTVGKSGKLYRQGDAIVLEPQMFPDTPNQPTFGSVRLDPGQTYHNVIVLRFSAPRIAGAGRAGKR
ncbi:MAG TPA: aldose epimerase family protein [Sphingomonas sp.]|nr:aldose epimerase family protein [Sphingomonas sp.]